jgi:hypothetical protein
MERIMIITNAKEFDKCKNFAMQILARGGFIDECTGDGKKHYVDTISIRANHIMQNEYLESGYTEYFGDDWNVEYATKEEYEDDKRNKQEQRKIWLEKVQNDLKTIIPNIYDGSFHITLVQCEVFAVMHVYTMKE